MRGKIGAARQSTGLNFEIQRRRSQSTGLSSSGEAAHIAQATRNGGIQRRRSHSTGLNLSLTQYDLLALPNTVQAQEWGDSEGAAHTVRA
jgi:hypothetical protein